VDTETAIQTQIEPRLVEAFGPHVANTLLTQATLCYVTTMGTEPKRYAAFVRSICSDTRLIQAWGSEAARQQEKDWQALLASVSGGRE
jgi:hypothetical protein